MYRSLYRRWRPLKFKEVVGQEHITRTLTHALLRNTVCHAYLFCGPRGTGKTSTAKILARAINCADTVEGEPCGECKPCRSISSGASMDVLELDAASNRGIDEVRELREKTRYAPSEGKYKVYIIDEVHMLTHEAFNALLKTLEEPPAGVVFILATTEPSRLPPTVISRCQRFDFRLLTLSEITGLMEEIGRREGWDLEEEALLIIARLSEGAVRDALGLLEQACAYGEGRVTAENVYAFTGLTGEDTIERIAEALAGEDVSGGLAAVQDVVYRGKDIQLFVKELMYFFTKLLVAQTSETISDSVVQEKRYLLCISRFKDAFSRDSLLEIIALLHQVSGEVRFSPYAHFIMEIAFLKMLRAVRFGQAPLLDSALRRLAQLEEKIGRAETEKGATGKAAPPAKQIKPKEAQPDSGTDNIDAVPRSKLLQSVPDPLNKEYTTGQHLERQPEKQEIALNESHSELWNRLQKSWPDILDSVKKTHVSTHAWLEPARLKELDKDTLVLAYSSEYFIHRERTMETSRRTIIEKVILNKVGKPVYLKCITGEEEDIKKPSSSEGISDTVPENPESKQDLYEDGGDDEILMQEALRLFQGKVLESDL